MQSEPATNQSALEDERDGPLSAKPVVLGVVLLSLIALIQIWIVSAGAFNSWPEYTHFYSDLSDAFVHGQLSLRTKPLPQLLALPDPYDPVANRGIRLHDAVLFDGKYYLYWGPVPALILAAACAIVGEGVPQIGDQYLVFPFLFGTVALAAILIFHVRARLFPRRRLWTTALPVISLGLGTPALYTLARSAVYEASICAGQFFLMGGLLAAWLGLCGPKTRPLFLILSGISLALSVGSRASLAIAVIAITGIAFWRIWRIRGSVQSALPAGGGLLVPLVIGAVLLCWYNHARFHSITEFGVQYQLAFRNQHKQAGSFSSLWYVPLNLYRYLFTTPTLHATFPFFTADSGEPVFAEWFTLPGGFGFESVIGIIWGQPFLLLGLIALAAPWWRQLNASQPLADRGATIWLTLSLAAAAGLGFAPSLTIEGSTMRYLLDTVPALTVLAAVGDWWLLGRLRKPAVFWHGVICIVLVFLTSLLGILLGTSGYYGNFARFNPGLYRFMHSFFHL